MVLGSIRSALKIGCNGAILAAFFAIIFFAKADERNIDHFILALSWQPAFCQYRPELAECSSKHQEERSAGHNLSLHGLWPIDRQNQPLSYCHVPTSDRAIDQKRRWCDIKAPPIKDSTRLDLAQAMPGALSCLDRHEWLKHGTCSGFDADLYFDLSADLATSIANTPFGQSLEKAAGGIIDVKDLRYSFEESFGKGTAKALSLQCREDGGRPYLSDIFVRFLPDLKAISGQETASSLASQLDLREERRKRTCSALIYIDPPGW